jgi:serine/threonine protein kinase
MANKGTLRKNNSSTSNGVGSDEVSYTDESERTNRWNGHFFVKKTLKQGANCFVCGKAIPLLTPVYKCLICRGFIHKKELQEAEDGSDCASRLKDGVLEKIGLPKKQVALQLALQSIKDGASINPNKLKTVLLLVLSDIQALTSDELFAVFDGKTIEGPSPRSPSSNSLSKRLSVKNISATVESEPVYDQLMTLIKNGANDSARIIGLRLLGVLLETEANRRAFTHFFEKPKDLLKQLNEKDKEIHNKFTFYRYLLAAINSLVTSDAAKEQLAIIGGLEHIIEFLKALFSIKVEKKDKERLKESNAAQLEGAKILSKYYQAGASYRVVIDKHDALSFIIIWCSHGEITIHNEIDPSEVSFDERIYDSPLCQVWVGKWQGQVVALKQFDAETITWEDFWKEVALLTVTQHPLTVRFYGACSKGAKPFMCIDYFKRGSLEKTLARDVNHTYPIDDSLIANMAMNAANGLHFLHSKHIIHRDVKTQNFLVDDQFHVKVIDFGVSRIIDSSKQMTLIGTPVWMAPEVISRSKYTEKADVYSYGLVLWAMCTGKSPFADINPFALANALVKDNIRPEVPADLNPVLSKLITRSWSVDPNERPSFIEILDILWNIKDPISGHYFVRVHEAVPDSMWIEKIFSQCDVNTIWNMSQTSKRFKGLLVQKLTKMNPRKKAQSVAVLNASNEIDKEKLSRSVPAKKQ